MFEAPRSEGIDELEARLLVSYIRKANADGEIDGVDMEALGWWARKFGATEDEQRLIFETIVNGDDDYIETGVATITEPELEVLQDALTNFN